MYFTPSVARSLGPATMPGIRTLAMGGEPIRGAKISRWTQAHTILDLYGPAECAQALSMVSLDAYSRYNYVGCSLGARIWLVKPDRPDRLAAVGTVGELLTEGPTVANGYFNDPDNTEAAFIRSPE